MASYKLTESEIELLALEVLTDDLGYTALFGPDLADGAAKEREFSDALLPQRLRQAIDRLNPHIPADARESAFRQVLRNPGFQPIDNNAYFHRLLTDGVDVKYGTGDGKSRTDKVWLVDFGHPERNEFLAVNQLTIIEDRHNRRPDIVLFVNGLPLVVIELKNPANDKADIRAAWQQLQTYQKEIPTLFDYNGFMIVSDGFYARAGTISSDYNRFMEWKTADGVHIIDSDLEAVMEPMFKGLLNKKTLLDVIRQFLVFETAKEKTIKKLAAYHQYYAVNAAIGQTLRAVGILSPQSGGAGGGLGDRRIGVVWHTQGSGKSLSMVFFAGKLVLEHGMNNPTIVVVTDRNDLDQQLFETFSNCQQLLRQTPVLTGSRAELRKLLAVASGGVVFTTIQKFVPEEKGDNFPTLTGRRNVVVIADEAHRSQYDFIDGFARHLHDALPNASFIGFTGTPIEKEDKNTQAVFGDYIHIYDIQQSVDDGATVRIYYENRLVKIEMNEEERKILDERVEEVLEQDELTDRQKRFAKWTGKEAVVGSEKRIRQVAADIVQHFEKRCGAMKGKGMIVCMSRRICILLHDEIMKLRPDWFDPADGKGALKVIMTGSASDPLNWQEHIRNKSRRQSIGDRLKDPGDPLKLVIVRDMWLTGFDAPALHTLYVDKPMNGHNLMQAIARVNRVFGDKTGGLVVDYIGIAQDLKAALATYTGSKGRGKIAFSQEDAVATMQEFYEIVVGMFDKFDYRKYFSLQPRQKLQHILDAANYLAELQDAEGKRIGKDRFKLNVIRLSKAFGISVPHPGALAIRDDLAFFQAVKARFDKFDEQKKKRTDGEVEVLIRQIVNDAIISKEVVDIFEAAGIQQPEFPILSDEFLAELKNMTRKNLALELLQRLLNDEIKLRSLTNIVQGKKFSEMLAEAIKRYQNGLITAAQVMDELSELSRKIREAGKRGEQMGLRDDELAFYDALAENERALHEMSDETLKKIAQELVAAVRKNTSIDWDVKESVQAGLRVMVKRILRKYKYPPDDPATHEYTESVTRVLEQAKGFARVWGEEG
ncbi:MAG: type I restriction endonuclease subunit R [Saprospiraceae bacterium]|nr:MAG: type I restriction endonuclease subunit R [Saprospiraceae bacterium]